MLENDLGRLILKLSNTIIKNRNRHLRALGLTSAQADSLKFYLTHKGATIKDLKEHLEISHQRAQGIVARMEEKGLLTLERSSSDKRYQRVTPTAEAVMLGERLSANRERTGALLQQGMTRLEQAEFLRLLTLAYENVKYDGAEKADRQAREDE